MDNFFENLEEIAAKTQIDKEFLKALQKRDFATLSRFNVRGFLKILAREYKLDFSEILSTYDDFLAEQRKHELDKLLNYQNEPKRDFSVIAKAFGWIIFIAFICFGFYYFATFSVFETKESLNQNKEVNLQNEPEILSQNENLKILNEENFDAHDEEIIFQNEEISKENEEISAFAKITTNEEIWIGIINLNDFRKIKNSTEKGEINLDLSFNQLILTGPAALILSNEKGENLEFKKGFRKRFLIKNKQIIQISKDEFIRLNQGKEW